MTRDQFIMDSYDQENRRLSELSEDIFLDKPKAGCEAEWKDCEERLEVLEQMIEEVPMDYIVNDEETGCIQQIFIGKIDGEPLEYVNCKDFNDKNYFICLIVKGYGDEKVYKNKGYLKLATKVWWDWFENCKYKKEKELRTAKKLDVYVKATVVDGEVTEIEWYE